MGIFAFILLCFIVGLVLYFLTPYMTPPIAQVATTAAVIVLVVILLNALGLFGHDVAIPHVFGR